MDIAPNVRLVPVTADNQAAVVDLEVAPDQRALIATNQKSLDQAGADDRLVPRAVVEGGVPVGFVLYTMRPHGVGLLHRIMVAHPHQGRGVGRAAMAAVLEELGRQGARTVFLSHRPENTRARRLFESFGFVEQEVESDGEVLCRRGPPAPIDE